jgi:hypothetical protein
LKTENREKEKKKQKKKKYKRRDHQTVAQQSQPTAPAH